MKITTGQTFSRTRTFTREDVESFGKISGDLGRHHVQPDAQGRVMLQGLLTATLATEVGGSINFLAREMHFEFLRPMWSSDTATCVVHAEKVEARDEKYDSLSAIFVITNQHGKEVLKGSVSGVVPCEP